MTRDTINKIYDYLIANDPNFIKYVEEQEKTDNDNQSFLYLDNSVNS